MKDSRLCFARDLAQYYAELVAKIDEQWRQRDEQQHLTATRCAMLWSSLKTAALIGMALGKPREETKRLLADSGAVYQLLLSKRGTEERIPVFEVRLVTGEIELGQRARGPDYSLGNSEQSLQAWCLCRLAGSEEVGREIARQIWDPPDSYVAARSRVVTSGEQICAFALREIVLKNHSGAHTHLSRFKPLRENRLMVARWKGLIALMKAASGMSDPIALKQAIVGMVEAHEKSAPTMKRAAIIEYLISLDAAGFASLAVERGLLSVDELSQALSARPVFWDAFRLTLVQA